MTCFSFTLSLSCLNVFLNVNVYLSLSGCLVSKWGCEHLALALSSNPSHLKELDLSYNHVGDSGVKELSKLLEDKVYRLEKLK